MRPFSPPWEKARSFSTPERPPSTRSWNSIVNEELGEVGPPVGSIDEVGSGGGSGATAGTPTTPGTAAPTTVPAPPTTTAPTTTTTILVRRGDIAQRKY